jgi:hypothetical protein
LRRQVTRAKAWKQYEENGFIISNGFGVFSCKDTLGNILGMLSHNFSRHWVE